MKLFTVKVKLFIRKVQSLFFMRVFASLLSFYLTGLVMEI